ncbi:hypothetical protein N805_02060 [Pseudomonas putida S13.1.2]|uniref:Uncharacterized protein n=1 Tax=Pseudomonas putida S13.1.2 TaxID=1384061 RepID=A0AAU8RZV0_PSEPU|nr:hypothetical protein N805_02060 [Pseudomonas putida S13.1.2]
MSTRAIGDACGSAGRDIVQWGGQALWRRFRSALHNDPVQLALGFWMEHRQRGGRQPVWSATAVRWAGHGVFRDTVEADIEQVVLQAFKLCSERHSEQLEIDVGFFLAYSAARRLGSMPSGNAIHPRAIRPCS